MSKKKKLLVSGIVLIVLVLGIGLYIGMRGKDEWGIKLWVTDVSPTQLTLHMQREDEPRKWDLHTGESYGIDKWTLFGWRGLNKKEYFTLVAYSVGENYYDSWNVNLETERGGLPMGLYRIGKSVTVEDYYENNEIGTDYMELIYSTPFFVASWWGILLCAVVIAILVGLIWVLWRRGILQLLKNMIVKRGKMIAIFLAVIVLVFGLAYLLLDYFAVEIESARFGYESVVHNVTSEGIRANIVYNGDGNEEEKQLLLGGTYCFIEKKSLIGWKEVVRMNAENFTSFTSIEEGTSRRYDIDWKNACGKLPSGTYRIKQPFTIYEEDVEFLSEGTFYITFIISE